MAGNCDDTDAYLELLAIVTTQRENVNKSLWEVEKHFTWWIYVILGFIALIWSSKWSSESQAVLSIDLGMFEIQKWVLISILCGFGIFISLFGYNAVRKAGEHSWEIMEVSNRTMWLIESKLKITDIPVKGEENKLIPDEWWPKEFKEKRKANRPFLELIGLKRPKRTDASEKPEKADLQENQGKPEKSRYVREYFQLIYVLGFGIFDLILGIAVFYLTSFFGSP
jgi:hypothetical protein